MEVDMVEWMYTSLTDEVLILPNHMVILNKAIPTTFRLFRVLTSER
jgi:hypothetical protein